MSSDAFEDFGVRMSEVRVLLNAAQECLVPTNASTYAKSAIVLACASVERYMNDVLEEMCRNFDEENWHDLSEGRQRYLLRHIALRMRDRAEVFANKATPSEADCEALASVVRECREALDDPSTWDYFADFGIFGEGSSAPDKIDAVLRAFETDGRSVHRYMKDEGVDLARVLSGLTQLVEARHGAAHALKGAVDPGPLDAAEWVECAATVVSHVDSFLGFAAM
jgi:hypothetical protein